MAKRIYKKGDSIILPEAALLLECGISEDVSLKYEKTKVEVFNENIGNSISFIINDKIWWIRTEDVKFADVGNWKQHIGGLNV